MKKIISIFVIVFSGLNSVAYASSSCHSGRIGTACITIDKAQQKDTFNSKDVKLDKSVFEFD